MKPYTLPPGNFTFHRNFIKMVKPVSQRAKVLIMEFKAREEIGEAFGKVVRFSRTPKSGPVGLLAMPHAQLLGLRCPWFALP